MSAIARYYLANGVKVYGYDKTETKLTKALLKEGAYIIYKEDCDLLPVTVDLVIYTPAIPKNNVLFQYYVESGIRVIKRAKALGEIANPHFQIAVAGSHGKTTLSSMIAHILVENGYKTTAFIGGICKNFNANFISTGNDYFVVEADEYDRSFHQLTPNIAIITAIDNDHLEVYPQRKDIVEAFSVFVNKIKKEGRVILHSREELESVAPSTVTIGYHLEEGDAHYRTEDLKVLNGAYSFNILNQPCILNMGGVYNVENAVAAFAVAHQIGIEKHKIASALANFKGINRRFEYLIKTDECVLIIDYAHHPQEINSLVNSIQQLYVNKNLKIIFQPHLFSRTEKLLLGFVSALSQADEVAMLNIYPAREKPIEGVTSYLINDKLNNSFDKVFDLDNVTECLTENDEVVVIVGAGDIDTKSEDIKNKLKELKKLS